MRNWKYGWGVLYWVLLVNLGFAQADYDLSVYVNGQEVSWQEVSAQNGVITASFEGGKLELNLADWDAFNYAHVLGIEFRRTANDIYTVSTVVRHDDTGWDNYADAFEVKGDAVKNGLRVLLHPHENEQPFTRSQSNVEAEGLVWVEAKDNVEGPGGSKIFVDLSNDVFVDLSSIHVTYELTKN